MPSKNPNTRVFELPIAQMPIRNYGKEIGLKAFKFGYISHEYAISFVITMHPWKLDMQ